MLLLVALSAIAQVKTSVSYKKVSATELDIVFTFQLESGWHLYGASMEPGGPMPASFKKDALSGAELKGKLTDGPGLKTAHDDIFDMDVKYYEGSATMTQRVTLTEARYSIEGYLSYQICREGACQPGKIEVNHQGTDGPKATAPAAKEAPAAKDVPAAKDEAAPKADEKSVAADEVQAEAEATAAPADSAAAAAAADVSADDTEGDLWGSSIERLRELDGKNLSDMSLWYIFLLGMLGGFVALCTPCVWPIIPMTVSFFLKRSKDKKSGVRDAMLYGVAIVVIYVTLGLLITSIFGAAALNSLSTSAVFNIFFCLLLVFFAASFFGGFEITLPSSWSNAVDSKAESTTGLLSIFLMAFALSLVSFSCTGPIIGFLLVEVSTAGSVSLAPTIGMLGFALALALPFTLFALFPTWLKSAPKSGGWLNVVKVTLGFLELAFALKFLSVADLAYGWHILDRETFLALWIAIFGLLGLYLLGKIKFPHDDDDTHIGVPRFFLALASIAFAIYMIPGLWGAPLKAISAFSPPVTTQDFNLYEVHVEPKFKNYDEGMAYAKKTGKPVVLDFTGYGCVNCRQMEASVWTDAGVSDMLNDDFVLISLYVDDKTDLPEPIVKTVNGEQVKLRTVGDLWSHLEGTKFGATAQPFYVIVGNDGEPLVKSYGFDTNPQNFADFLKAGLKAYDESKAK